jgi:hypothetical protein
MVLTWISRRIVIGVVVCTLTLGGFLLQPAGTLAGFGTSPGPGVIARINDGTSNT